MLRIVADSNIFISALNFGGVAEEVLVLGRQKIIKIFISPPILKEIEGVLLKKFKWSREKVQEATSGIKGFTEIIIPQEKIRVFRNANEADNRILECALAVKANAIVTGDKALQRLKNFRGIKIKRPREFLEELR